jgi:hypothetical protein
LPLPAKKILQKFDNMKKDYDTFIALKDQSGFGWNEELQVPECNNDTWNRYVKHNKNAKKFKNKGLRNLDKLVDILEGKRATGEFARSRGKKRIRSASLAEGGSSSQDRNSAVGDSEFTDSPVAGLAAALEDDHDSDLPNASQLLSRSSLATPDVTGSTTVIDSDSDLPPARTSRKVAVLPSKRSTSVAGRQNRRNKVTGGARISRSLDGLAETAREIATFRSRANIKFLELYSDFTAEDKVRVFKLFKDEASAELFLSMTDEESRDLWLQTELEELA